MMFMILIYIFVVNLSPLECKQNGPTLETVSNIVCPSDRPNVCLPYGTCCRVSEFCYLGLCESCFPLNVPSESLLAWCRNTGHTNVTSMRHHACRLACHDMFSDKLFSSCLEAQDKDRSNVTLTDPRNALKCGHVSKGSSTALVTTLACVLVTLLATTAIVTIVFCFRRRHKINRLRNYIYKYARRRQSASTVNDDIREVVGRAEQVITALKREGGSDRLVDENVSELMQSLHNQLTELSQVLRHLIRSRGSVSTISAVAVLESDTVSVVRLKDLKLSQQKQLSEFV